MLQNSFFERPNNFWIRWVVLIPITIIAYTLTSPLVKILLEYIPSIIYDLSDFYIRYNIPLIAGIASGWVMVTIPCLIAPYHKLIVSIIFLVITLILTILVIIIGTDENPQYSSLTESLAHIIGAIIAITQYINETSKDNETA